MYRNCIYCAADLGANESVETFPVGRTLAFDGARGRLWAVCGRCARWNLAPLEERWEAVEAAERAFREARVRVQSLNVGLGRLADGTRLVRVGAALPAELADARYSRAYQRRHRVHTVRSVGMGTAGVLAGLPVAMTAAMATAGSVLPTLLLVGSGLAVYELASEPGRLEGLVARWRENAHGAWAALRNPRRRDGQPVQPPGRVLAWARAPEGGGPIPLARAHLRGARMVPADEGRFALHLPALDLRLDGWHADALAGRLALRLNRHGGDARDVTSALRSIHTSGGTAGYLDRLSARGVEIGPGASRMGIQSLALEMALHEETERRAMEGELAGLEAMWQQAEEIAAIADRLPDDVPPADPPRLR